MRTRRHTRKSLYTKGEQFWNLLAQYERTETTIREYRERILLMEAKQIRRDIAIKYQREAEIVPVEPKPR